MNVSVSAARFDRSRLVAIWIAVAVVSVVAVAVAPLAAFVLMISAFGVPHVLYELRYVDERFSARASRGALGLIGLLVGLIALARVANSAHVLNATAFVPLELSLGALLAFTAAAFMRENKALGAAIGAAFAIGATFQPTATFLIWAWLHNLTPMGFVAEIAEGAERRRWLGLLIIPFFVLPALVATGVFHWLADLALPGIEGRAYSAFGAGDKPLASFLAPGWADLHLFSAAVVAQAMHYVAVIVLMPMLLRERQARPASTIVPWPSWRAFAGGVTVIAAIAFCIYAVSYSDARAGYAVAAAIHAWIELPVLLLALGQGFASPSGSARAQASSG